MPTAYGDAKKAPPSVDFILQQHSYLQGYYAVRNSEYKVLRDLFRGDFTSAQQSKLIPSIFNDRLEITYNLINAVIRRQMDSMSQPPRTECEPRGIEDADTALADAQGKLLERIWKENRMAVKLIHAAFYQGLLDKAVIYVLPDPKMKFRVRIEIAIPESYLPMPSGADWFCHPFVIYSFNSFDPEDVSSKAITSIDNTAMAYEHSVAFHRTVIYWDGEWYVEVKDGKEKLRIRHTFGKMPFFLAHNIPLPHQFRGQGDTDQAVGLNVYLNRLISNEAQIIDYAANPIVVIRGGPNGATNLPFAPRAQWNLGREGNAQFLQWAGSPPAVEAQRLWTMQAIEDVTAVSSAAMGRDIPSGVSGNAVRSLTAGYNSRVGTKQTLMGDALIQMNEQALLILEHVFGDETFEVIGESRIGSREGLKVKPSQFRGWYENTVIFEPFDPSTRFFMEMEKHKSKLQSRFTTMRRLGIRNPSEEIQRIKLEVEADAQDESLMAQAREGELPIAGSGNPLDLSDLVLPAGLGKGAAAPAKDSPLAVAQGYAPIPGAPDQSGTARKELTRGQLIEAVQAQAKAGGPRLKGNVALLNDPSTSDELRVMVEDPTDEAEAKRLLGGVGRRVSVSVGRPPADAQLLSRARPGAPPKSEPGRAPQRGPGGFLLGVVVMSSQQVSPGVYTATIAVESGNSGRDVLVTIGKTEPMRGEPLDPAEGIMVEVAGVTKRGSRYTVARARPTGQPAGQVSTVADLERIAGAA